MQEYFYSLANFLQSQVKGHEQFTCWFSAENSDFVRFNCGAIRQPGLVRQIYLTTTLIDGSRQANYSTALTGNLGTDHGHLSQFVSSLRDQLPDLPEDPYLLFSTDVCSTEQITTSGLQASHAIVDDIMAMAQPYDFVGILAAGPVYRGFANSFGQRNWHETTSFNLDWSLYQGHDKAVKSAYAGYEWDNQRFKDKFQDAVSHLDSLRMEPLALKLGTYRAYLTPSALSEVIGLLNWGGFSEKSLRTKQSPLGRMRDEGLQLNPAINISENMGNGLSPRFQREGFIKPERIGLLDQGQLSGSMISPRTAKEYGIVTNGATGNEMMVSAEVEAGVLSDDKILAELDTGIFISNLWYLNYSDRANCRITGMTRFATFWVENGAIKAPLKAVRFDDSIYRLLGENLIALTRERELLIDNESYGQRCTDSLLLPGALVNAFTFVL